MSVQEVLRSITEEDLVALELGELQALTQLSSQALVTKSKQTVQACKEEVSAMEQEREEEALSLEQQRQTLLKFEPKLLACFASSPVKLNVGGTYFSTSVENLTREPDTFFSAMFSGRWDVKTDPHDKAVFVDRDPAMFGLIVNYMRTGKIAVTHLQQAQVEALFEEADFYQIASLLKLLPKLIASLPKPTFSPKLKGIQLSKDRSRATHVGDSGDFEYAISLAAFSPSLREMKVRLIKGESVLIGVAPKSILEARMEYKNCGWHVYALNGCLYSQNGNSGKLFKRKINEGSVVTIKLDEEFDISCEVDGEDWGVAYSGVANDYSVPLHLSVALRQPGDAAELLLSHRIEF